MIKNKKDYEEYIKKDFQVNYGEKGRKQLFKDRILRNHNYYMYKYLVLLRKDELYTNKNGLMNKILKIYIRRKRSKLGNILGLSIPVNVIDKGTKIWHYNVIVNGYAKVGENCVFHGENCVGNNSFSMNAPIIGKNVDIGIGAKIIGNVTIADDIVIGANSVVTKSFLEKGIVIAGIPARKIKNRDDINV